MGREGTRTGRRQARAGEGRGWKRVERGQIVFRVVDVAYLIEEDHPARAVWEFVGRLDLGAFHATIKAVQGVAGRLQEHLQAAREQVAAMGDPQEDTTARQQAARERAGRERVERLERPP